METTRFQSYEPGQLLLMPPDLRQWLEEGHPAYFILDVVEVLDLSAILASYDGSRGGRPGFDPRLLVALLLYGYCVGVHSSRKLERATYESVPFRILAANQHPDHATIAEFRRRHLGALSQLFVQVLQLCEKAGLVRLGHVAMDGTKLRANASKHKAMSYGRMEEKLSELEGQVKELLAAAEAADQAEDAQYGSRRGDELPEELQLRQKRLEKIRQAKAELEAEAQAEAQRQLAEKAAQAGGGAEKPTKGSEPAPEKVVRPAQKAQRNFTDPDSRIMRDGATKSFEQSYNCQAVVDSQAQVIVAAQVTQQANDKQQVKPLLEQMKANLGGRKPAELSADAGYFSEDNVSYLEGQQIDAYVATGRQKHGTTPSVTAEVVIPDQATVRERMAAKLQSSNGKKVYSKRKEIVEPVFGQIKEARGLRRFLLRGLEPVQAEWSLICTTHNLLKLFRSGWRPMLAEVGR